MSMTRSYCRGSIVPGSSPLVAFSQQASSLLPAAKLGAAPPSRSRRTSTPKNNLPDALARWQERAGTEIDRTRTEQSFTVTKADIVANGYDLSINRYKELVHDDVEHRDPREILKELFALEDEIRRGIADVESML